jgi:PAS domain S-box-containing protein
VKATAPNLSPLRLRRLHTRLAEAEEALRAIHAGEMDTIVVKSTKGARIFSLEGNEHGYRMLIESMNEGALTVTDKGIVLYANRCFARMIRLPLEQVLGSSIHRLLARADQHVLRDHLRRSALIGSKFQVILHSGDGLRLPVHLSIRRLAKNGSAIKSYGIVVTDVSEVRSYEDRLRNLTNRVVQAQEGERARLALELHDNITQQLCAIVVHSHVLVETLSSHKGTSKAEAVVLRDLLGSAAEEVERITSFLRPGVLRELGLIAVIRETIARSTALSGTTITLIGKPLTRMLTADTELAIYRIFQEAIKNVEKHAQARHVTVRLRQQRDLILLEITDDGIGFKPMPHPLNGKARDHLGLLGMHERAVYVGGLLTIVSTAGAGTTVEARIPMRLPTSSALARSRSKVMLSVP